LSLSKMLPIFTNTRTLVQTWPTTTQPQRLHIFGSADPQALDMLTTCDPQCQVMVYAL